MTRLADDLGYMIESSRMNDICDVCVHRLLNDDRYDDDCVNGNEDFCLMAVLWEHRQEMADCIMKLPFIKEHEVIAKFFLKENA